MKLVAERQWQRTGDAEEDRMYLNTAGEGLLEVARRDLAEGLGPEFADFDIADLNPRTFVRKHLLDDLEADPVVPEPESPYGGDAPHSAAVLSPGESPPYDAEAT